MRLNTKGNGANKFTRQYDVYTITVGISQYVYRKQYNKHVQINMMNTYMKYYNKSMHKCRHALTCV